MKNQIDESLPEGIQTLATDLPADNAASTAAPGTGATAAAAQPAAPFLTESDGSWIGSRVNKNYEAFLQSHKDELAAFEEAERETRSCRNQFQWFTKTIADWQMRLTALREEITRYQGVNIENTLFDQCWQGSKPLIVVASSPLFQTMLTIKLHGAAMLKLPSRNLARWKRNFWISSARSGPS